MPKENLRRMRRERDAAVALRQSEEKYRTIFDNAGDLILICGERAQILAANPLACKRLGYTRLELISLTADTINSPEEAPCVQDRITRLMKGGHLSYETVYRHKDGSLIPVEVNARRITWEGQPAMMSICRDISERKRSEAAMLASNARLRQLALELSRVEERERRRLALCLHDEIAPSLALLRIKLGILGETLSPGPAQTEIAQIRDQLGKTLGQTRSLVFDLSPPVLHHLDLTAALEWAGEKICQDHGLRFVCSDDGEPKPLSDEWKILLFRCVREIMMNAVKHAKATRLTLAMERLGGLICVTVEDDGCGFDVSRLDWRNHKVGFGLFSVRECLDALGGRCEIDSEPGRGTRVSLTITAQRPSEDDR
ncbi:MAG TPA: PAS domain S-box protein [Rectinemataceae bacterium]|nr:PAS domain S-box protein [Rectinemataceae bacterium]